MLDAFALTSNGQAGSVPRVAFVGSYPPRECGIGTFTYDVVSSYDSIDPSRLSTVIAINDDGQMYDYDLHDYQGRVRYQIESGDVGHVSGNRGRNKSFSDSGREYSARIRAVRWGRRRIHSGVHDAGCRSRLC